MEMKVYNITQEMAAAAARQASEALRSAIARKAEAVKNCFGDSAVSAQFPASILKEHPAAFLFLDQESASLLDR